MKRRMLLLNLGYPVALLIAVIGVNSIHAADVTADNLTVNQSAGIGTTPTSPYRLDIVGWARATNFYISGPHSPGEKEFLRDNTNSSSTIYGVEIRNWSGEPWASPCNNIIMLAEDPTAPVGITAILDNSAQYDSSPAIPREFRIGSYNFSGADVVLFPGQVKALVAKSSGNVGIGTSDPQAALDVKGPILIEPQGDILMGQFGN